VVSNPQIPKGCERVIKEDGTERILCEAEDSKGAYSNSFLPIIFERASVIARRIMTDCVKDYGLTSIHASYLIALNIREGLTLTELSNFLDIDAANTNRVVKVLKEKELVYDNRPTPRSKMFNLFLTDEGKVLVNRITAVTQENMNIFCKGISKLNIDNMRCTLIQMLNNADPDFGDYVDSKLVVCPPHT